MIRRRLKRDFMSINVWLFKQPAKHDDLKAHAELPEDLIDVDFANSVTELFETVAAQTRTVRHFNNKPVTGPRLKLLYEQVLDVLNDGADIHVPSVFRAMEMERCSKIEADALTKYRGAIKELTPDLPVPAGELRERLDTLRENMLAEFRAGTASSSLTDELTGAAE